MALFGGRILICTIALQALISFAETDDTCDGDVCPEHSAGRATALLQTQTGRVVKRDPSKVGEHLEHSSSFTFARLASQAAGDGGFCTGYPCRVSLLQGPPGSFTKHRPSLNAVSGKAASGKTAPLSEAGYSLVVAMRDDIQMREFILRVVEKNDCEVVEDGGLAGIVPWFSGTTMSQSFVELENTLLFAVLSHTKNSTSWLAFKNSEGISGDTAELSFVGYVEIAAMKDDEEMKKFARRVCQDMGVNIVDEGGFSGMVQYYSGTDNFQSFDRLQSEVISAANTPHAWGDWEPGRRPPPERQASLIQQQSIQKGHKRLEGFALMAAKSPNGFCIAYPCRVSLLSMSAPHSSTLPGAAAMHHGVGKVATLDEKGYQQVASVKNDAEMMNYILRMVDKYDCKVEEIGGLAGIVPWFSGTTTKQSMDKLEGTLLFAVLSMSKKPWLSYKNSDHITGDTAALNFVGYVQVAAMRSDAEMKRFVRRICKDAKIEIVDEGGFTGMVRYYSGTENFQSYDGLINEVKSAANAPHSWARKMNSTSKSI